MSDEKITLRDIYKVVERVEDKMDARLKEVENDLDSVKAFQNRTLGIASVFATFVSLAATYIWNKIIGNNQN